MRRVKVTDVLVPAFIISMLLPDNWYDQFHFGEVPIGTIIFACLGLGLTVNLLRQPKAMRPWLAVGLVALAATSAGGYLRGNVGTYTLKFYIADIFVFCSLLAGYTLGSIRGPEGSSRVAVQTAMIASWAIILTYLGLFAGIVKSAFEIGGGRTMTESIFHALGILIILLPWVAVSTRGSDRFGGWRTLLFFSAALGASLLSATRSCLIAVILAAAFYVILKKRRFSVGFFLRLAGGVAILVVPIASGLYSTFVFERLNGTEVTEESRYMELDSWWSQTKDDIVFGQGMGSQFLSVSQIMALAPHIGVVTPLMKGGIFLFVWCIVAPSLVAVRMVFSARYSDTQRGAAAAVLVYVFLSTLSTGWDVLELFTYGLAVSSMARDRIRRTPYLRDSATPVKQLAHS